MVMEYLRKTWLLAEISMPTDCDISIKEYNNRSKYKDLEIKIEKMWNLKTTTVIAIVGSQNIIKKGTDKHINKIPSSPSL